MSYDARKLLRGQEFVEELEIHFNGCKFAQDPYGDQNIFFKSGGAVISPATFGVNIVTDNALFPDWYATWSGYPSGSLYAEVYKRGEIIKIQIVNPTTILVTARGQFGTTAVQIPATQQIRLMHIGEADGSCRGFSQTCSDPNSYDANVFRIIKHCTAPKVAGSLFLPGFRSETSQYESAEADVGESIGSPARLKFTLQDFNGGDDVVVPYPNKRSSAGTFWGRTLARNPYYAGRKVIYRAGLRDHGTYGEPDYVVRHFVIDSMGLSGGFLSCSCLDPIILTEDKKAKMPVVSPAQLSADIAGSPASFSYVNAPDYYYASMGATIYVRIDSEIIKCTVGGPKLLTVVTRGYRSSAKDHSAGATVQDCVRFAGTHVIDAIVYALENFTQIPSAYIGDYTAVKALIPTVDLDEAIISKPQPVAEFISTMIKLGNLIFYFDESLLQIVINYIPELAIEPININENEHIKRGSASIDENNKEQYTRFAHMWAPVDVTTDADENYAINYMAANLDVESPAKLGEINEKKTFKNPLLTTSAGDSLIATSYCARVVQGADKAPKIFTGIIEAGSIGNTQGGALEIGSIINLVTKENQNVDGVPSAELYQVRKISGDAYKNFEVKMRRYLAVQPAGVNFVITTGGVNYDLSAHYAPAAGHYTVYIEADVIFGSFNVAIPAFTTGAQAAGVSFTIIHRGQMLGMGGTGGDAGISSTTHQIGQVGGIAFNATVDCEIDCGAGLIWAGGGGGTGEPYIPPQGPGPYYVPRSGGGGGQGYGNAQGGRNTDGIGFTDRAQSGSQASPGILNCPDGGQWGLSGEIVFGITPALPGEAIKSNGKTVTITSGNNDFNIRGRRT